MKIQVILPSITFLLLVAVQNVASKQPHIIFLYIDDLGWNDVSFHGSLQIPTPNADTLAYTGVILNNYYVQPLCTPSRGSLMTAKYATNLGLQHFVITAPAPWGLSRKEVILPQHLKKLGYATHGVGKWHLGYFRSEYLPTRRGFDSFFGYCNGKDDYFTHFQKDVDDDMCGLDFYDNEKIDWSYMGKYGTEVFTDKAVKVIKNHNSSKPLFLYFSHQAVHTGGADRPLQAPEEYILKFLHIKDQQRRTFAAMASVMDDSIGEIVSALDERDMLENSILIFTTDNGGAVRGLENGTGSNFPLRGCKYTVWEGGVRGAAFIWSHLLHDSKGSVNNNLMHITDWLPTLYSAAGGDPKDLGEIDGYNFWPSLLLKEKSPRDHILHNIDPVWKTEAIRKDQYKLVKERPNGENDWYDKEGKKRENTPFDEEEKCSQYKRYEESLKESKVYNILKRKSKRSLIFHSKSAPEDHAPKYCKDLPDENKCSEKNYDHPHPFGSPVKVDCGEKPKNAATNCPPGEKHCLYDIGKDPCEYNNLAGESSLSGIYKELQEMLEDYRSQAVPIRNKPTDPRANPRYHGNAWVPWQDENRQLNITEKQLC